ncbi:MAG: DUF4199 domain-containing protein [Bacteroidales bacterium]|nr:DUF4199 domain-containing protein [Bacteroidales bacterium]
MLPPIKSPYRRGADDGFYFGLYLSALFLASVCAVKTPFFAFVTMLMMLGVPFIIYYFLRRTYVVERGTSLLSALWMQGIMIFICGSLISGVVAIVYLKWVDPDFVINLVKEARDIYRESDWPQAEETANILQRMIDNHLVPSAISLVIEMIWFSVFTGSLLSVLMGLLARARKLPSEVADNP